MYQKNAAVTNKSDQTAALLFWLFIHSLLSRDCVKEQAPYKTRVSSLKPTLMEFAFGSNLEKSPGGLLVYRLGVPHLIQTAGSAMFSGFLHFFPHGLWFHLSYTSQVYGKKICFF